MAMKDMAALKKRLRASTPESGTFLGSPKYIGMIRITIEELEVADAAHFMGYDLMRGRDGYILARKFGTDAEVIRAPTLKQITEYLKH